MNSILDRRDFLKTIGLGAASVVFPGCAGAPQTRKSAFGVPLNASGRFARNSSGKRPNFVFIFIDDLGWKDVGFMGSKYYETPNIDKLAGQGIVFTSAYANAPNCAPTRASLLSGQYTPRHGVYTVGNPERGKAHLRKLIPIPNKTKLDSKVVTIAEALKPAGYVTASIGKWHLGRGAETGPEGQGFDVNIAGNRAGMTRRHFSPYRLENLTDGPKGEYLTDRLTDEAINFIEANKSRPFFLYLSHYAVHTPIQAKKAMIDKYMNKTPSGGQKNPTFAAMVESVDQSVGRIMTRLDELGLTDNTVVFFFSDNGGVVGITSMEPLRGGKGMLYEGGIRVPLVVRSPGRIKPGSCDTPVIGTDFYPTILEMAGVPKPKGHVLDGESIIPLLKGGNNLKRDAIFWHFPAYLQRNYGWKETWRTTPAGAVRQGHWKLIEYFEDGALELYNLKDDIAEQNNLAEKMPEKTNQLHKLLKSWRKSVNAPVPTEPNPRYNPG
ncbi:MAG: sulfatase-like hydrolase/transferase [Planctomycetota bacterium]|jgi:arylsulfatase A-like enzyme